MEYDDAHEVTDGDKEMAEYLEFEDLDIMVKHTDLIVTGTLYRAPEKADWFENLIVQYYDDTEGLVNIPDFVLDLLVPGTENYSGNITRPQTLREAIMDEIYLAEQTRIALHWEPLE